MEIGRAVGLAQQSELLSELGAAPTPVVMLTIDLIWAGAFLALFWRLRRRPWSRPLRWATLVLLGGQLATEAWRLSVLAQATDPAWLARLLPLGLFALYSCWALFRPAHAAHRVATTD